MVTVKRTPAEQRVVLLPRHGAVESSFAWLPLYRRMEMADAFALILVAFPASIADSPIR